MGRSTAGGEMTTRDAAMDRAKEFFTSQHEKPEYFKSVATIRVLRLMADFAEAELARTTDLARLLEAMRRDAVDADGYSSALHVHIHADGYGYVRWGNGEIASFK